MFPKKCLWALSAVAGLAASSSSQVPNRLPLESATAPPAYAVSDSLPCEATTAIHINPADPFKGNQKFQNFIGFLSNPLQSIDPRALTESYPIFANYHTSTIPALPSASLQLYGSGLTVAYGERFSFGLNQGGYEQVYFSRNQPGRLADRLPDRFGILRDRSNYAGLRQGWLDFGGFAQYTVIEDVEDQFLVTGGMRFVTPTGAKQLFQGSPPWQMAPYITAGKEIGEFHILANAGYSFDAGSTKDSSDNFYANVHLDRRCFGWLYPLVEVNSSFPSKDVPLGLPTRRGFLDFGNFSASGTVVTLAAGANAVIVPNKIELGAVYTTSVYTQRNFDVNGFIVRMTLRY